MCKTLSLCEGRHEMPSEVEGSIFPQEVNPLDISGMQQIVAEKLNKVTVLDLYVTGLTVALMEVIKYCLKNKVELTLFHYNSATGKYYGQAVTGWYCTQCGLCRDCDAQQAYECGGMGATFEVL